MKTRGYTFITGVLLAAAFLFGCGGGNEFAAPPAPTVTVQTPDQRDVTTYQTFSGRTEAKENVEIRARVRGYLDSIEFNAGQYVEKGQLLFTIEPDFYQATLDAAVAGVGQAKASAKLAQTTAKKKEDLFTKRAISELEYLEAKAAAEVAVAAVKQAEAAVENAKLDLGYTKIHSPVAGRVSREQVTVGNLVGSGENTLLTTVVSDDPIYAYFSVSERDLLLYLTGRDAGTGRMKDTIIVRAQLADGSDYAHEGELDFTDNRVDEATGTIEVRAVFPNPDKTLLPGLFTRILLPELREDALLVPDIAVQRDLAGTYLLVVDEESTVQTRYVTLGARVDAERIIEEGLDPDDRVIVNGIQRARPGIKVQAESAEAPDNE